MNDINIRPNKAIFTPDGSPPIWPGNCKLHAKYYVCDVCEPPKAGSYEIPDDGQYQLCPICGVSLGEVEYSYPARQVNAAISHLIRCVLMYVDQKTEKQT